MESVEVQVPCAPCEKEVGLTQEAEAFEIRMGGYVDESNAVTLGPEVYCPGPNSSMPPYDQVFEPNLYVVIENTGETDVVNPWLVANGQRDWWSVETMAKEAIGGRDLDEEDRMMALWQFVVDEVYDSRCGMSWYDDVSDPVKLFNAYGFEGCIGYAIATSRLGEVMGVKSREVWVGGILDGHGRGRQCSHTIFEAWANGAWHLLDTDQMVFFLNRDNRTVASVADLARDPRTDEQVAPKSGAGGKGSGGEGLLQRAVRESGICISDQSEWCLDARRWPGATGYDAVAAAPYDGDALAAGREVGALLGSGGQDGGAGASAAPGGAVFQRQTGLSARFAKSAGVERIRTAGECGAGNVGAIAGCSSDSGTARFPNDLEGVFAISNCRSAGGVVLQTGEQGRRA